MVKVAVVVEAKETVDVVDVIEDAVEVTVVVVEVIVHMDEVVDNAIEAILHLIIMHALAVATL